MHTTSGILQKIVELNEIKQAYNHYLCSYEGVIDVENTTYIIANKAILSYNLKELYALLAKEKEVNKQLNTQTTLRYRYKASKVEERAIFHFNSDKRFTITE